MAELEVRSLRDQNWFWCHNAMLDHYGRSLGPYALSVYMALCRHANNETGVAKITSERLSRSLKMADSTARKQVGTLLRAGLISIQRGGLNQPNIYTLLKIHPPCDGTRRETADGTPSGGEVVRRAAATYKTTETNQTTPLFPDGNEVEIIPSGEPDKVSWASLTPAQKIAGESVFDYYISVSGRNKNMYRFDSEKKGKAAKRLKECLEITNNDLAKSVEFMKSCVDALFASDYHTAQGRYKNGHRFIEFDKHLFHSKAKLMFWLENS